MCRRVSLTPGPRASSSGNGPDRPPVPLDLTGGLPPEGITPPVEVEVVLPATLALVAAVVPLERPEDPHRPPLPHTDHPVVSRARKEASVPGPCYLVHTVHVLLVDG
eukprot:760634-Hanusia_phi.AAC.1